jgi:hypothetical protein
VTATPYLTAEQVQSRDNRFPSRDWTAAAIEAQVASFEPIAEGYRGIAYTPRDRVQTFMVESCDRLVLDRKRIRSVTSVTVDGVALSATRIKLDPAGVLHIIGAVSGLVVATYSHGYDSPPPLVLDACTEYVFCVLTGRASGVSRNTLSVGTEAGTTRYSTPDWNAGRPTGWLDVDRLLNDLADERVGLA